MADSVPSSRWRILAGSMNCLVGSLVCALSLFSAVATVRSTIASGAVAWTAVPWMLFIGGIGGALLWIGVGDLRGRRRPTWIVRSALYVCVVAIVTPVLVISVRNASRKRQAINNLQTLREALRQYEATYQVPPSAPTLPTATAGPDR